MWIDFSTSYVLELVLAEGSQIPFCQYGTASVSQKSITHNASSRVYSLERTAPFCILMKKSKGVFSFPLKRKKNANSTITVLIPDGQIIYSKDKGKSLYLSIELMEVTPDIDSLKHKYKKVTY